MNTIKKKRVSKALNDGSFLIDARLSISEANEGLPVQIPEREEYDSIAGYILFKLGKIPASGEKIDEEQFSLAIHQASPRQIYKVKLTPHEPQTQHA